MSLDDIQSEGDREEVQGTPSLAGVATELANVVGMDSDSGEVSSFVPTFGNLCAQSSWI